MFGSVQPQPLLQNQPDGTAWLLVRHRSRDQARRHPLRPHPPAVPWKTPGAAKLLPDVFRARTPRRWAQRERGLNSHLDGARLFNAAVALGRPYQRHGALGERPREIADLFRQSCRSA